MENERSHIQKHAVPVHEAYEVSKNCKIGVKGFEDFKL